MQQPTLHYFTLTFTTSRLLSLEKDELSELPKTIDKNDIPPFVNVQLLIEE